MDALQRRHRLRQYSLVFAASDRRRGGGPASTPFCMCPERYLSVRHSPIACARPGSAMGNKHAAEKLFWELVQDYDAWTRQQLAPPYHPSSTAASKALAIAQTMAFLVEAATQAGRENWEAAARACTDLAAT